MGDLGDIGFLMEGAVSNLEWLDVNEAEYRAQDRLPEQNLAIAPDLQALWDHKDKPASFYLEPNKDRPQTMTEVARGDKFASVEDITKVARLALMQSNDLDQFRGVMTTRFDSRSLTAAREQLKQVFAERGLLGRVYVDANDFSNCAQSPKRVTAFVQRYASTAPFVVGKQACGGCIHRSAGDACAVFHKQIVMDGVPYSDELASRFEQSQMSRGKLIQASSLLPKERIRAAMLAPDVAISSGHQSAKPIVNPVQFMRQAKEPGKVYLPVIASQKQQNETASLAYGNDATSLKKLAADKKAFEVVALLRREMLRGRGEGELIQSLKLSFTMDDIKATRPAWEPLFKQAGFYGTIFSTQESFDDCHVGADFLAKHNPTVKGIVAGGKCGGCVHNKLARCGMYGKPLVASADELMTTDTVQQVIREHRVAGRLDTQTEMSKWGSTPQGALKAIYRTASKANAHIATPMREQVTRAHNAMSREYISSGLTKREVLKSASMYLNEGLYGTQLAQALKRRFDPRDLVASKEELKVLFAEQGLQGIYYVDPTIYDDYGNGCAKAASLHRSRLVPYVKVGSKCETCIHQTKVGYCSKLNKNLVVEPPYIDKSAQQREMLATGEATENRIETLMIDKSNVVQAFQMHHELDVEINEPVKTDKLAIELGGAEIEV